MKYETLVLSCARHLLLFVLQRDAQGVDDAQRRLVIANFPDFDDDGFVDFDEIAGTAAEEDFGADGFHNGKKNSGHLDCSRWPGVSKLHKAQLHPAFSQAAWTLPVPPGPLGWAALCGF